jgi:hypothetical protein
MDIPLNIKEDSFSVMGSKTLCFSDNPERFIVFTDTGGVFGDQTTKVLSFSEFIEKSVLFVADDLKRFRVKLNFDDESWLHFDTKSHRDTEAFLQRVVEWANPVNTPDIYFAAEVESSFFAQIKEDYEAASEDSSSLLSIGSDILFRNDCVPINISVQGGRVQIRVMNYLPSELPLSKLIVTLTGGLLECRNTLMIGDVWRLHGFQINLVSESFAAKYLEDLGLLHVISDGEGDSACVGLIGQVHVEGLMSGTTLEKTVYDALIEESTLTILKQNTGEPISSFSLDSPALAIDGTAQEFLLSPDHETTIKITSESEEFLLAIFNNRPTRRRAYISSNTGPFVAMTKAGEYVRIDADQGRLLFSSKSCFQMDVAEEKVAYKITTTDTKISLSLGEHKLFAELPTLEGIASKVAAAHSRQLLHADFEGNLANLIILEQKYLTYCLFGKLAEIQLLISKTTDSDPLDAVSLATGVQERSTFLSIMLQLIATRTREIGTTLYGLPGFLVERDKEFLSTLGLDGRFDFLEEMTNYLEATEACRGLITNLANVQNRTAQYDSYREESGQGAGWETYAAKGASLANNTLWMGPMGFITTAISEGASYINEQNARSENAGKLLHGSFVSCAQEWDFIIQVVVPSLADRFNRTTYHIRNLIASLLLASYQNDGEEQKAKLINVVAERMGRLEVFMHFPSTDDSEITRSSCIDLLMRIQEQTEAFKPRYF